VTPPTSSPPGKDGPHRAYWRANLRYLAVLLFIWFAVSFGCGILFVDQLDRIRIGGFKLGFWFAQQGSIYVFIVLIFVYVALMNRLDRRHDVDERKRTDR
jgi:putative solute:sodium symporter small subunit